MSVKSLPTNMQGLVLIEPTVHADERGFFVETYRENIWSEFGINCEFVQDNHSRSARGTLRGMHFQYPPGQAKLIRCARGKILDVVVDLRKDSTTFGKWEGFELDDNSGRELFVPVGFAHGFCVLSEVADVVYKCSNYYDGSIEAGIAYDDPEVGIQWPELELIVSERDQTAPKLSEIKDSLPF